MLSVTSIALFSCFAFALASPASTLTCSMFSVPDEPVSFTLLAVGQSDDSFRHSLALGNVAGATVLALAGTLASTLDTNFTLVDNGLYSHPTGYISNAVTPSGLLSFTASTTGTATPAYCEGFNTSPHGVEFPYELAVGTDFGGFALCAASGASSSVTVIVYAPVNGTTTPYDASTCVPVFVHPVHDCC